MQTTIQTKRGPLINANSKLGKHLSLQEGKPRSGRVSPAAGDLHALNTGTNAGLENREVSCALFLPEELWVNGILNELSIYDLGCMRKVCKDFNTLVKKFLEQANYTWVTPVMRELRMNVCLKGPFKKPGRWTERIASLEMFISRKADKLYSGSLLECAMIIYFTKSDFEGLWFLEARDCVTTSPVERPFSKEADVWKKRHKEISEGYEYLAKKYDKLVSAFKERLFELTIAPFIELTIASVAAFVHYVVVWIAMLGLARVMDKLEKKEILNKFQFQLTGLISILAVWMVTAYLISGSLRPFGRALYGAWVMFVIGYVITSLSLKETEAGMTIDIQGK